MPLSADTSSSTTTPSNNTTEPTTFAIITAQFTVIPNRIVVVDSSDKVIEIWNNTCPENSYYCLKIKELDSHGLEHSLTPQILERYNSLLNEIDWSKQGKVFPYKM
jgi:hypothetical protein